MSFSHFSIGIISILGERDTGVGGKGVEGTIIEGVFSVVGWIVWGFIKPSVKGGN